MSGPHGKIGCQASHGRFVRAIALVSYPDAPDEPSTYACVGCLTNVIRDTLDDGESILISPLPEIRVRVRAAAS